MQNLTIIQFAAVAALPLLFAITLHEFAHGWVAHRLGDATAARLGRLTLNPIRHVDPVGTLLVPAILLVLQAGFLFGWAKPVPVDWRNLGRPKRDMAIVAAAGPLANLFMALLWALIAKIGLLLTGSVDWMGVPMVLMGQIGITINLVLMVLNLIPLPPLDGGRVLTGILPMPWAMYLARVEPFGFFILLGLIVTNILWQIMNPAITTLYRGISSVFGL